MRCNSLAWKLLLTSSLRIHIHVRTVLAKGKMATWQEVQESSSCTANHSRLSHMQWPESFPWNFLRVPWHCLTPSLLSMGKICYKAVRYFRSALTRRHKVKKFLINWLFLLFLVIVRKEVPWRGIIKGYISHQELVTLEVTSHSSYSARRRVLRSAVRGLECSHKPRWRELKMKHTKIS